MKLYFYSIFDVLRARTNQIADIRLCEGFSQAGCDVEMITPYVWRRDNISRDQVFDCYGVATPFRLRILPTPFLDDMGPWLVLPLMLACVLFSTLRILVANMGRLSDVVIMSRTPDLLIPIILLKKLPFLRGGPLVVTWAHEVIFRRRYEWVYRNSDAIVGTNSAITEDLQAQLGIAADRLAISLNPVSDAQVSNRVSRAEARRVLGLEGDAPLVVYTGKLGIGHAEAEYILEAARRLPDCRFLLTGGRPPVVDHYREFCRREGIGNVTFVGFVHDYNRVRYYQAAADVLVSYYTMADHLTRYNLPNKICEYMLAGGTIVTCDFAATRDVLNADNAIFVEPESAEALAAGIGRAVRDRDLARGLAERALGDVRRMTYRQRAEALAAFFRRLLGKAGPAVAA